ncbi:hypothetical protein FEM48_Zijuj03G0041300 [Ziziphus jujuba var. spinosa]|uniref:DRBM domain-containing protein n=1 Tax=Ziziphus jujuba var. spinosa TaxID=714518 RepID=A0A978VN33_ZIZJJ|nr:hypothetical protein FEM48_Zijuj03G0041300 [Ziziphus jujuba var. spinosa]
MNKSEKGRERLKAIRMEAAHAENSNNVVFASMPCNLANPLVDTSTAMSLNEGSCATSRFDFYTDPMAAFSADKKRNNAGVSNCYVFKSRLQEYAQKVSLPTPVYETIKEGPSHEPSFRSTVIVNDVRYNSLPGFFNRKAAEQSAAEVALMELAKSVDIDACISQPVHETGLCKNLLQEYAQKMNYAIPLYQCQKIEAPGRVPHFSCTVEIGGIRYIGAAARTKKEAEIKAARTALLAIQSSTSESFEKSIGNRQLTVIPCKKRAAESCIVPQENANVPKTKKARHKKMKLKKKLSDDKVFQTQFQNAKKLASKTNNGKESNCEPNASILGCKQLATEPMTSPHDVKGQSEKVKSVVEGTLVPNMDGNSANEQPTVLDFNVSSDGIVTMYCGDTTLCSNKANEVSGFGEVVLPVNNSSVDQPKASSMVGLDQVE